MKNPDFKYIDCAIGSVSKRNNIIDTTQKHKSLEGMTDCYKTYFRYGEDIKAYVANNLDRYGRPSIAGYKGKCFADYLPIDIDNEDLKTAHKNTIFILNRLHEMYDIDLKNLWCFFSGSKGFHILIPEPLIGTYASDSYNLVFREMAKEILQGIEFDSSIYDKTRLFRVPNTINSKSGLYKIPLQVDEILSLSIDEIKELAKAPRKIEFISPGDMQENEILHQMFTDIHKSIVDTKEDKPLRNDIENLPPKTKLCYLKMLQGVEINRDNTALKLAVNYKKQGINQQVIYGMLQSWNQLNKPPLEDKDIQRITEQAFENEYDFGCNDEDIKRYCDKRCFLYNKPDAEITKIYDIKELQSEYMEYVKNLDKAQIKLGIPEIDKHIRGIAPGEICQIIARSSVGKTMMLLNIIRNINKEQDTPVLFFSLEMPAAQIYERLAQQANLMSGEKVEGSFKNNDTREIIELTERAFKNLLVIDMDFLTIEDLTKYVELAEKKFKKPIGVICIDYLGRMKSNKRTEYEQMSELAQQIKHLAKVTNKAVVCLHQTNRTGGKGDEEISMDMARGSGVIEEAADQIIAMWRPDIAKEEAQKSETEPIVLAILKNRKGKCGKVELVFHKPHLRVYSKDSFIPVDKPPKDLPF